MNRKQAIWYAAAAVALLLLAAGIWVIAANRKQNMQTGQTAKTITVVMDDNYPPYSFRNADGKLQGILIDQWALWSETTGIQAEVTGMNWADALAAMRRGEYDVLDTAFFNEEREEWLDFSDPYVTINVSICHSKDIGGVTDAASLRGFTVAVKAGDNCIPVLEESGVNEVVEYPSYDLIVDDAKDGKVRVFVMDDPSATYYLYKKNVADEFLKGEAVYSGQLHRAVSEGNTELLKLVEDGFHQISSHDLEMIDNLWFGKAGVSLYFSYFLKFVLIAAAVIGAVVLWIVLWNRRLRKEVRDKTNELVREKKLLSITLQSIGDGVVATDVKGHVTLINPTARRLSGWEDDALGQPLPDVLRLVNEQTGEPVGSPVEKVLETGEIVGLANHTALVNREGMLIPIADGAAPICDSDGNLYGVVMVFRDVTEEKAHRDRIEYIVSHDSMTGLYNRWYMEEALRLYERDPKAACALIMGDLNGLKLINDAFGHNEGDRFIQKIATILQTSCGPQDAVCRWGGDEFLILMPDASLEDAEHVTERILTRCTEESTETMQLSIALGYSMKRDETDDINRVLREAEQLTYRKKLMIEKSFRSSVINALLATLAARSEETEEHAARLRQNCDSIGKILGISAKERDEMLLFAVLHDIGKVGINDAVLQKPGPLTSEEWLEMRKHPEIGFRIAQNNVDLAPIAEYILSHHERWDGKGYPRGLAGEEIPLLSRILAVVDAYDAMTSERVYRKAISGEEAAAEILRNAGTQFDPEIADIFVSRVLGFSSDVTK